MRKPVESLEKWFENDPRAQNLKKFIGVLGNGREDAHQ